ncbi:uncharacterized protein LOC117603812 [Osmia lignaria lignaria]|uniref:uncharacterized protein LOC117603812 n=1 Tax=Osmia lignaria lignaria TaxID=1437193 RepID=UPI00402BBF89
MSNLPHDSTITIENRSYRSYETRNELTEPGPVDGSSTSGELARKLLTTLPWKFKSLQSVPIIVDSEKPADLIELLGNILEITDYATNMASFWFLNMLALQLLYRHKDLDEHHLGVLISWLIGEITLLRERHHSREEFFKEMREIFMAAAEEVSNQDRLLYWDEIMYESDAEEETEEEEEYTKHLQKGQFNESRRNVGKSEQTLKSQFSSLLQETPKHSSNIDPLFALEKVIESTYNMYANELRYSLVYAVFVEPIEVQTYNLPFVFRPPRPVKFTDKTMSFNMQLRESVKKIKAIEKARMTTGKRKGKANDKVPVTPPPSLSDEKILTTKRLFILPLIDANEALKVFEPQ